MNWKDDASRSFKRARLAVVDKAFNHLPGERPIDLHESYSNISKTSCVMLLEAHLKKRQRSYKTELGDARAKRFELEKRKYSILFANFFKEARLPIVEHINVLGNAETAWFHLFAARRGNTLKNRYKAWKPFRDWLEVHRSRTFPAGIKDAIDYIESRIEDGCGKTVPESFSVALHFMETLGRVPEAEKISSDELWKSHVKSWGAELAQDAPPRKPAAMYTTAMLLSLELMVVDENTPSFLRCLAWVILCMVWGSLRCDDIQAALPHRMMLSNFGLRMVLAKTKTTGHDKAQKEVQAFVAPFGVAQWCGLVGCRILALDRTPIQLQERFPCHGTCGKFSWTEETISVSRGLELLYQAVAWAVESAQEDVGRLGARYQPSFVAGRSGISLLWSQSKELHDFSCCRVGV